MAVAFGRALWEVDEQTFVRKSSHGRNEMLRHQHVNAVRISGEDVVEIIQIQEQNKEVLVECL